MLLLAAAVSADPAIDPVIAPLWDTAKMLQTFGLIAAVVILGAFCFYLLREIRDLNKDRLADQKAHFDIVQGILDKTTTVMVETRGSNERMINTLESFKVVLDRVGTCNYPRGRRAPSE